MPGFTDAVANRYQLSVIDSEDRVYTEKVITFNSNAYGSILVKTDKPIYKPSQVGKYPMQLMNNTIEQLMYPFLL